MSKNLCGGLLTHPLKCGPREGDPWSGNLLRSRLARRLLFALERLCVGCLPLNTGNPSHMALPPILGGNDWEDRSPFFAEVGDGGERLRLLASVDYSPPGDRRHRKPGGLSVEFELNLADQTPVPHTRRSYEFLLKPALESLPGEVAGLAIAAAKSGEVLAEMKSTLPGLADLLASTPIFRIIGDSLDGVRLVRAIPSAVQLPDVVPEYAHPILRVAQDAVRGCAEGGAQFAKVELEKVAREGVQQVDHGARQARRLLGVAEVIKGHCPRVVAAAWKKTAEKWEALSETAREQFIEESNAGPITNGIDGLEGRPWGRIAKRTCCG